MNKHQYYEDNRISIVTSEELMSAVTIDKDPKELRWNGLTILVKPFLPLHDVVDFVNGVMEMCFNKEHSIAVPEAVDFSLRLNTILRYTTIQMPQDIDDQYNILYLTDLYDTVIKIINKDQMNSIKDTIGLFTKRLYSGDGS